MLFFYGGTVIPEGIEGIRWSLLFFVEELPNSLVDIAIVLVLWSPLCLFLACLSVEAKVRFRGSST